MSFRGATWTWVRRSSHGTECEPLEETGSETRAKNSIAYTNDVEKKPRPNRKYLFTFYVRGRALAKKPKSMQTHALHTIQSEHVREQIH